jgi:hypothetical protein
METISKAQTQIRTTVSEKSETKVNTLWEKAEAARFGILPILLTVVACVGGWAAAFGAHYEVMQLAMVALPTMIVLSFMLAVAPMKNILISSAIAIVLDFLVLLF